MKDEGPMSGRTELSTTLQDPNLEPASPASATVALIGPNATHRRIMAHALSGSDARTVREFADYPANLGDVPHLMEERFDVVMIDIDSDQSYALQLVESIAAYNTSIVMVYSMRDDPELIRDCMRAGARDFLPLPEDANAEAEPASEAVPAPAPAPALVSEPKLAPEPELAPEPKLAPASEPAPAPVPHADAAEFLRGPEPEVKAEEEAPLNLADFLLTTPRTVPEPVATEPPFEIKEYSVPSRPQFVEPKRAEPRPAAPPSAEARRPDPMPHVQPEELRRPVVPAKPAAEESRSSGSNPGPKSGSKPGSKPESKGEDFSAWDSLWIRSPQSATAKAVEPEASVASEAPAKRKLAIPSGPQLVQKALARAEAEAVPASTAAPMFRQVEPESAVQGRPAWVRWAILGGVPLVVVALILMIFLPSHRAAAPAAQAQPAAAQAQPATAGDSSADGQAAARTIAKPSAATPVADEPAKTAPVSSEMMDAQLNAPSRIAGSLRKPVQQADEPPSGGFALGSMDSGSSLPGQVFDPSHGTKVVPAVSAISAGVADGMLVHKTAPVYPEIAKSAHVSGTVVLSASITKSGNLINVRVVSGPAMLRNSAMEAVKNWRYRPYLLNNQPVEVETTIRLVFSLDRN
jgi:protein TonB